MKIQIRKTCDCLLLATVALLGSLAASADTVYVAYVNTNSIEKFDLVTGADLGVFASTGLSEPFSLALDSAGDLYVTNVANNTIEEFTPAGLGSVFANAGLAVPVGLAADGAGNIYVGNTTSNQFGPGYVQKFTPGGVGSFFASTGDDPSGLAFDSAGNLYVANANDNTIYKITPGGVVFLFASTASYPGGLAVDSAGNLYVTIYFSNTIEKFSSDGTDLGAFASTGLSGPVGLAFDSAGNLYVANANNNTIERFTTGGVGTLFANTGGVPTSIAIRQIAAHQIAMGPQAMEGNLTLSPGATLQAGYDFTMPGSHPTATVNFVGANVTFAWTCASGPGNGTLVVPMADQNYTDPQSSPSWYPSGDQNSSLVYQGSIAVPDECSGGLVSFRAGGTFSTGISSTDTTDKVNVRWHYSGNGSAGGWSGTKSVVPN